MELELILIENPEQLNLILGQAHFIKTAEDLYEALVNAVPGIQFGLAFCEASGPRLVRTEGNDEGLQELAAKNALAIGAGHAFLIFMREAYPLNLLATLRNVPEVVGLYCATSNPVQVIVAEEGEGRGILGVIDGERAKGIETEADVFARRKLLSDLGYKL